jgi:hypothetical protein
MDIVKSSLALAMVSAVALVACQHEQATSPVYTGSATPTYEPPSGLTSMQGAPGDAILADGLATARCDHELQCQHLGAGQAFGGLSDCVPQLRAAMKAELERYGCIGLSSSGTSGCMSAITAEPCEASPNDLAHLGQCDRASVCTTAP